MMRDIVGDRLVAPSFDELMMELLLDLECPDFVCKPRGSEVREILLPRIVLTDPRARLLTCECRDVNYGFGVGEFLWYWRGSNSLDEMLYYNKRMGSFSDDQRTLNSAYGYIMRGRALYEPKDDSSDVNIDMTIDQWSMVKRTLCKDPDSRRAIIQIMHPVHCLNADTFGSHDVPCTLSLQFFVRDNRLHMHAHMRSNDVMWGLTYDLFSFTLLQECMMLELRNDPDFGIKDLQLGRYLHTAGSMHVYERHYDLSRKMIDEYARRPSDWISSSNVKRMEPLTSVDEIETLVSYERALRSGVISPMDPSAITGLVSGTSRWMAEKLNDNRRKRDREKR